VKIIKQIGDRHLFELLRGSAVALFFRVFGMVAGFVFIWVINDIYGSGGLGLFNTIWAVLLISTVIAKLGFDSSIVKFIAGFYGQKKFSFISTIYKIGLSWISMASIGVGIIIFIFSKELAIRFFESSEQSNLFVITAFLVLPLSVINFNAETLKGLKNITAFSSFQNGTIFLSTLLFVGVFYYFREMQEDIIEALGIALLSLVPISFWVVRKTMRKKINKEFTHCDPFPLKRYSILKITLPMLYTNSLFLIMSWTDTIMISANMDNSDVGIYNTALKIAAISSTMLMAVSSIAMPKYAELFERKDFHLFKNFAKQTTLITVLVSLPLFLVIFLFPSFLLNIFDPEFIEAKGALLILACGHLFTAISGSTIQLLSMSGKEKIARNILLSSAIINVSLNYILIPIWGITGAAIATASTTIIWNSLAVWFIYRKFGFLTFPIHVKIK